MQLKGKRIAALGDSITEGYCASSNDKCFVEMLGKISEAERVYNYGIGGTRIAKQTKPSEDRTWDQDFCSRVEGMQPDVDAVIVLGGTNDFGHGDAPFGKMGDKTCETFCGACYELMQKLVTKYPSIPIVIMTPLHRTGENDLINKFGRKRLPLFEYVDIIKKTAAIFSLPVLDLYSCAGMQPNIEAQCKLYYEDGLHPNDTGHERIAKIIKQFFEANIAE